MKPFMKKINELLKHRNVSEQLIYNNENINLEEDIIDIEYKDNRINKKVTKKKQIQYYKETICDPFGSPYIMAISSQYNSIKSQSIALKIFSNAIKDHSTAHEPDKSFPYWYPIYGGYKDNLRDDASYKSKVGKPSLLVLDNISINSTDIKLEKIRDLLYMNRDIPRILVLSEICPLEFMYTKIYFEINRVVYLGKKTISI